MRDVARAGDRIRLLDMPNDPAPIEPGTTGTVTKVSRCGGMPDQLWVDWDTPRTLMLIEGTDVYEIIESQVCRFCKTPLHLADDETWVDDTDGDCCSGDDNLTNDNEPHIPA